MAEIGEIYACRIDDVRPSLLPAASLARVPHWPRFAYGHPAGDDLESRLRIYHFDALTGPSAVRWIEDLLVYILPGNQVCRALVATGMYEPNTQVLLRQWCHPGGVMLDVGANMGFFTLPLSLWVGKGGRVIAFEPSQRERHWLESNIALNRLDNVVVVPMAASDHRGEAALLLGSEIHNGLNTLAADFVY